MQLIITWTCRTAVVVCYCSWSIAFNLIKNQNHIASHLILTDNLMTSANTKVEVGELV